MSYPATPAHSPTYKQAASTVASAAGAVACSEVGAWAGGAA